METNPYLPSPHESELEVLDEYCVMNTSRLSLREIWRLQPRMGAGFRAIALQLLGIPQTCFFAFKPSLRSLTETEIPIPLADSVQNARRQIDSAGFEFLFYCTSPMLGLGRKVQCVAVSPDRKTLLVVGMIYFPRVAISHERFLLSVVKGKCYITTSRPESIKPLQDSVIHRFVDASVETLYQHHVQRLTMDDADILRFHSSQDAYLFAKERELLLNRELLRRGVLQYATPAQLESLTTRHFAILEQDRNLFRPYYVITWGICFLVVAWIAYDDHYFRPGVSSRVATTMAPILFVIAAIWVGMTVLKLQSEIKK